MSSNKFSISQDLQGAQDALKTIQLVRINELSELTTLSKSCINLWVAQGKLIPPITLSSTVKVWVLKDVINWIENQKNNQSSLGGQS